MENIKEITPKIIRNSVVIDMVKFINENNKHEKITEVKTTGNLLYEGNLRNIGFYNNENVLIGVISLNMAWVCNLTILKKYDSTFFREMVLNCIDAIYRKLNISKYLIEGQTGDKKIFYWIKPINQKRIKYFRSIVPENLYTEETKLADVEIYLKMLKNKELIRVTEKNVLDLFRIWKTYHEITDVQKFTEKQMIIFFLNKNPEIVTYFIRSTNLLCFRRIVRFNRTTGKKISTGKVEFLLYNPENIREIKHRFCNLLNLIWRIEKIDQIIFESVDGSVLFDDKCSPFQETYVEKVM